ncbi:MAG: translation elongation factor Ts [Lactobacillaceae bacterium]|jgi:elongation factor Ts|nr:translation elongation factor Ts [Lactobacillaceae bacterium]
MAEVTASMVKELRDKTSAGMMDAKKALVEAEGDMEKAVDLLRERGVKKAAKKADRIAAEGMTYTVVDGNRAAIIELNSETDYVATNEQFNALLQLVGKTVLENNPADIQAALAIVLDNGNTLDAEIVQTSANTGEKITFRRFTVLEKADAQHFGAYSHQGGSVSTLIVIDGGSDDVAKDIAMHAAAMAPQYVSRVDVPSEIVDKEREVQMASEDLAGKPDEIKAKMVEGRLSKFLADVTLLDQPFVKGSGETVAEYAKQNGATVVEMVRYAVGEGIEKQVTNLADEVAKQING